MEIFMKNIILIIILLLSGCAIDDREAKYSQPTTSSYELQETPNGELYVPINCRHLALITASAMESYGIPYQIVRGDLLKYNGEVEGHVHTRALVNGIWYWLELRTPHRIYFREEFYFNSGTFDPWEDGTPGARYTSVQLLAKIIQWDDLRSQPQE